MCIRDSGEGKRYNIEIQRADRGAGAKRARYYSSLLDANLLDAGAKYEKLPETYVIFITEQMCIRDRCTGPEAGVSWSPGFSVSPLYYKWQKLSRIFFS